MEIENEMEIKLAGVWFNLNFLCVHFYLHVSTKEKNMFIHNESSLLIKWRRPSVPLRTIRIHCLFTIHFALSLCWTDGFNLMSGLICLCCSQQHLKSTWKYTYHIPTLNTLSLFFIVLDEYFMHFTHTQLRWYARK